MKTKTLLLLCLVLCTICAVAQHAERSILYKENSSLQNLTAFSSLSSAYNIGTYHYAQWSIDGESVTKSRAYRRALNGRNTGIGLMAGGGAGMIIGSALLADGVLGLKRGRINGLQTAGRIYEVYFGALFAIAGVSLTIPGAVVTARNSAKMRKIKARAMENP